MEIENIRAQVKGSIWQGIAQSGVPLASLPVEQQTQLVESIANSVMLAMNGVLEDTHKAQTQTPSDLIEDEKVLWEGRPFLSLAESYALTSERIKIITGVFGKDTENIELVRIQDIDVTQNLSERIFNIGDLHIRGADPSNPTVVMRNVTAPQEVYETLRKAWLAARKRYGLQFREMM